jgi:hypothetical protein
VQTQPQFLPLINPSSKYSKKANFEKSQQQQSASMLSANKRVTVELADLDWEDRETVLRLLFSKMNTGEAATNWRDGETLEGKPESRDESRGLNDGFQQEEQYYDEESEV